jgi:RNA polymerase sigma-70 factor (ECF subfamily)
MNDNEDLRQARPGRRRFATTRWSQVLAAGHAPTAASRDALASLCEIYWYPLYAYVRRWGHGADDAEDLTQEFFSRLLEKHYLRDADPTRGRFRSFLLASLKHFLSNERDRATAVKRGGRVSIVALEVETAEGMYSREPPDADTPEKVFERRWALTVLERTLERLRKEFAESGKQKSFALLEGYLTGDRETVPYAQLAGKLEMTEGAIKVAVHRLRRRFGALLREEIGETVSDPSQVDDEIRDLFRILSTR